MLYCRTERAEQAGGPVLDSRVRTSDDPRIASSLPFSRQLLHAARHELLEREGLEHHPDIPAYTLAELQVKYKAPLRSQDAFLGTVAVHKVSRVKVQFSQRLLLLHPASPEQDEVRPLFANVLQSRRDFPTVRSYADLAWLFMPWLAHAIVCDQAPLWQQYQLGLSGRDRCMAHCGRTRLSRVQEVLTAVATVVLLDDNYRPMRMPPVFRDAIAKYMAAEAAS